MGDTASAELTEIVPEADAMRRSMSVGPRGASGAGDIGGSAGKAKGIGRAGIGVCDN